VVCSRLCFPFPCLCRNFINTSKLVKCGKTICLWIQLSLRNFYLSSLILWYQPISTSHAIVSIYFTIYILPNLCNMKTFLQIDCLIGVLNFSWTEALMTDHEPLSVSSSVEGIRFTATVLCHWHCLDTKKDILQLIVMPAFLVSCNIDHFSIWVWSLKWNLFCWLYRLQSIVGSVIFCY